MSAPVIPGDPVYLGSFLANTHWYGVAGDGETPAMQVATMEAVGQDAVIVLDALKGDKGDKGDPAEVVRLQWDPEVMQTADLPAGLGLEDTGKAWWINNMVYYWIGDRFVVRPMGSPGPTGATPQITVTMERIAPGQESTVQQSGTSANPILHFRISAPAGPAGPASAIRLAEDYDNTFPPEHGQIPTWNSVKNKFEPSDFAARHPRLYSIPEAAFTNFTGPAQRQNVLSYQIEPQDYDWTPLVEGHLKAVGVVLSTDPFLIGCEVRLGDPITGELIGRGFGNISNWTTIRPHFSTSTDPTRAVSPDNGIAVVAAGVQATINVNLYNDGILGAYSFNRNGAQLTVTTIPVG